MSIKLLGKANVKSIHGLLTRSFLMKAFALSAYVFMLNGCSSSTKNVMYTQKPSTWREPVEYNFILLNNGTLEKSFKPLGMRGSKFLITTESGANKEISSGDIAAFQDKVAFYRNVKDLGFVTRRVRGAINSYSKSTSYITPGTGKTGTMDGFPTTHSYTTVFIERNNDGNLVRIDYKKEDLILLKEWMKDSPAAMERLSKVKVLRGGYLSGNVDIKEAIEIYDKEHPEVKNLFN